MALSGFLSQEEAGGLNNVIYADFAPRNLFRLELRVNLDFLTVNDDGILGVLDGTGVLTMHGVVTQHVSHVIRSHERIVNCYEVDVRVLQACTEYHTTDAAKAVDTYFDSHSSDILLKNGELRIFLVHDIIIPSHSNCYNARFVKIIIRK